MKHLFAFLCVLLSLKSFSQNSQYPKTKFFVGYFGETLTHLGLNLGLEYYPFQSEKYQIILSSNIGGYTHIRNNTSVFVREQWGQRITFKNGVLIDNFIGIGYLHNFTHGGKTFEVLPNGAVQKVPNYGRPMVMPSIGLGTGYNFSKKTTFPLTFYIRPELFWKAPFNGYYLTHFALNTGFIFSITHKNEK